MFPSESDTIKQPGTTCTTSFPYSNPSLHLHGQRSWLSATGCAESSKGYWLESWLLLSLGQGMEKQRLLPKPWNGSRTRESNASGMGWTRQTGNSAVFYGICLRASGRLLLISASGWKAKPFNSPLPAPITSASWLLCSHPWLN